MNGTILFTDYKKERIAQIEQALSAVFPEHEDLPDHLREAMNYSLMAGGKRLRALLVLAAAEALGCSPEKAMPVACGIELVHTYSLIHDDLPAMDDDDYRRGKPTNHKVFGEAMAILAGDGLLTHAFYCITQARQLGVPVDELLSIVEELSLYAGARGMVGGQVADIEGEQGITSMEQLESIHARKTGALFIFALRAGGRIAGATPEQLAALTTYATNIGFAFQIQDDVLDVTGDAAKLGKPVKSDERQQKVTYPYFIGLEASIAKMQQLTTEGKEAIMQADFPNREILLQLADFMLQRDR